MFLFPPCLFAASIRAYNQRKGSIDVDVHTLIRGVRCR